MPKLTVKGVRNLARSIVASQPGGIRYGNLVAEIREQNPETPENTIMGSVWNLHTIFPEEIAKPSRGLFTPAGASGSEVLAIGNLEQVAPTGIRVKESEFYEPFAEWLKNDLDEVSTVASLGGAVLKSKWGTPDVVGIYKPLASNLIKFPIEIVSAEIKIDPQAPVVAFGQAVAYRLFSAKTYIAMPTALSQEEPRTSGVAMHGVGSLRFKQRRTQVLYSYARSTLFTGYVLRERICRAIKAPRRRTVRRTLRVTNAIVFMSLT